MRALWLTPVLGFSLVACTVGQGGIGGDDVAPNCGNNTIDAEETCDDGNTASGDGCSSTCQTEAQPRLDVTVDKATLTTELASTNMLTVTLTGSDGFAGPVTLAASVLDPTNTPLTAWTVALDNTTVDVPENGTATAVATLTIPSENLGLMGTVKIDATSTAGTGNFSAVTMVTAANQLTIPVKLDANGQCVYPAAGTMKMTVSSTIRFLNQDATSRITIHVQGDPNEPNNFDHQPDPGSAPGTAFEQTPTTTGNVEWYCHAPGPTVNNLKVAVLAPQ